MKFSINGLVTFTEEIFTGKFIFCEVFTAFSFTKFIQYIHCFWSKLPSRHLPTES